MASERVNEEQALAWWAEQLKDQTVSPLTRDYPESAAENVPKRPIEAVESLAAPSSTSDALKKLSVLGSTITVIQTALVVLVSRLTGDEDISIGTNGQPDGPAFVLRTSVAASESFSQLFKRIQDLSRQASQKHVPLDVLQSHLKTPALFKFAAVNVNRTDDGASLPGVDETADFVLTYSLSSAGALRMTARYNQRLVSSARVAGILTQITTFLQNAAVDVDAPIGGIVFATHEEQQILPNPTSDLEWSSFRGAIHDIFSANAEAHPDRTCVVETKSEDGPERRFNYRQIHEASNILAHHLVRSGLERGDVVMIYSYRGVDLVVAVMGTLKAGGTFSVLDPAYPPDRQNIYLDVSRPRALVVIEKATEDAGELSPKVRGFIEENLNLKTEVPALRLQNDGFLQGGGDVDGKDMFESVRAAQSKSPGVVVGPDSVPTLSFTSGSEGKPKGVRGRHYSLTFYYDWMARTFNLSDQDKFTMLSGIAHDPIQRDMFTPLFLGAQILVPSKDDIQNERLAEWMREHGATVTHLTPAMGQILVGGAVARFEKLHHAFFVGDILIKRDCRSLQNLAPNVRILNMYGTTETSRAVSFYEIPSRHEREGHLDGMKDVIPAGRGMYNVQMLVVNRFDRGRLCAVGEIGEIYVRASGLAEGYLGTPELTRAKFVDNWFPGHERGLEADRKRYDQTPKQPWAEFYRGPRDRLYRSGDLGRYTPSGDVECSGRADDQVKIRGFRIELGEIDTHLSQHPLVRENVTLVRRDKFEEQTLVSYVVPQIKAWTEFLADKGKEDVADDGSLVGRFERFRLLQREVQEYLRTKLPAYAVPSIIVPMRAMPLNPNGKVDKPKLPFPDTAMLSASRRRKSSTVPQQLGESELALAHIWAKLVPGLIPHTIKPTESFFDLGGESMKAQQLAYQVRRTLGVDLGIGKIYNRPTLKEMAAIVDQVRAADALEGRLDHDPTAGAAAPDGVAAADDDHYGADAEKMAKELLPSSFPTAAPFSPSGGPPTVFLTGATGFLGSFILKDLLDRTAPEVKKVMVLVRAQDETTGMLRVKMTCQAYGVWSDSWESRIQCLPGQLGPARFGLSDAQWQCLVDEADVVIHNGAQVHWINTYDTLKGPNVMGTLEGLKLCVSGRPKSFSFVSSTSVLDHDHYVFESERIVAAGGEGISEDDDLTGSRTGLGTGYGQSKWVAEYLCREAGRRGLRGCVVRPGYVLGSSRTGVTNTDDFLIRMLKGCVQLGTRPNINNTVNMVPVDHVARTVVACSFYPPPCPPSGRKADGVAGVAGDGGVGVAQITGHPRLRFNQYLAALQTYGYTAALVDYVPWASSLEHYVSTHEDFALMPLFTFVANDLPSNTRAPELDDSNAERALYADREWTRQDRSEGSGVTKNTIGLYLAYLVQIGFLPEPNTTPEVPVPRQQHQRHHSTAVKTLPPVTIPDTQRKALANVGGRGGLG